MTKAPFLTPSGEATFPQAASCSCGACAFQVRTRPIARFFCHCTICQAYTGRPFSDVTVLRAKDVDVQAGSPIVFKKYRPPPNVNRGRCTVCDKPAIEFFGAGPLKLALIPTSNYPRIETLPDPALHVFYDRRTAEVADDLPKVSGYVVSQTRLVALLARGLLGYT